MQIIQEEFDRIVPNPVCELRYNSTFQLLVAVVLSAQCTDARVNAVTKTLFQKYPTVFDFAKLSEQQLGKEIYSLGFYRAKSKNLIALSKDIIQKFGGTVPNTMKELVSLPGVGRKTASVVLAEAFGVPAFAVDTHVFRVANRLGIGSAKSADHCEEALKQVFPKSSWCKTHLQMVHFGRYFCKAQKPNCSACNLKKICLYYNQKKDKNVLR